MRASALLAIGAGPPSAISKKRRRRCDQQNASVTGLVRDTVGNGPVGNIAVALHDAAIAIEQFERVESAATGRVGIGHRGRVGPAPWPIVTRYCPEETLLGATPAGISTGAVVSSTAILPAVRIINLAQPEPESGRACQRQCRYRDLRHQPALLWIDRRQRGHFAIARGTDRPGASVLAQQA